MSKSHRSVASEVAHMRGEINRMSPQEVLDLYGIELRAGGRVYDHTYNQEFADLAAWVSFNNQQDAEKYEERFSYGKYDDEDY